MLSLDGFYQTGRSRFLSGNLSAAAAAPEGKDRPRLFSNDVGDYGPYLFNGQL